MLVAKEALPDYMFGSLRYAGIDWRSQPQLVESGLTGFRRATNRGYYHLPFFLIFDLTALFALGFEAPFVSDRNRTEDDDLRVLLSRYEREFLARLLQAPGLTSALELATASNHAPAIRHRILELLLAQFGPLYRAAWEVNPSEVRDVELPESLEFDSDFAAASEPLADTADLLTAFLNRAAEEIRWAELLRQEDLFELNHLQILDSEHLRIGCRQILRFSRQLASEAPLRIDLSQHENEADTAFLDETHYPSGGLTGLTNRGSFENLVASELVYLEETAMDEISLFELRYIERELLFYMRDSGILRRKRRRIHMVIDLGELFHVKSADQPYQYSVLSQAFCLRLIDDFFEIFEADSLRFQLHYLPTGNHEALCSELEVMQLLLYDYIKHGWVAAGQVAELKVGDLVDPRRKSYLIVLACRRRWSHWASRIQQAKDENLPIHAALYTPEGEPLTRETKAGVISQVLK